MIDREETGRPAKKIKLVDEKVIKKKKREENKFKKLAEVKAIDEMAEQIFKTQMDADCWSCAHKDKKLREMETNLKSVQVEYLAMKDRVDELEDNLSSQKIIRSRLEQELQQLTHTRKRIPGMAKLSANFTL